MATVMRGSFADKALNGAAIFWLLTALAGQWAFFVYLVAFYGPTTLSGNFEAWNRLAALGARPYEPGDTAGNLAFAAHALGAALVALGGALQLVPWIRAHAPAFHRWNGRVFLCTVTALSLSGFYLVWVRLSGTSTLGAVTTTINGVLILVFAMRTFITARARELGAHRRWAMRLYLVSNAQWFTRVGVFGYFVTGSVLGLRPSFNDPFLTFWSVGCFLVPLLVLEAYVRTKDGSSRAGRFAFAGALGLLTLVMAAGIVGFGAFSALIVSGKPLAFPG